MRAGHGCSAALAAEAVLALLDIATGETRSRAASTCCRCSRSRSRARAAARSRSIGVAAIAVALAEPGWCGDSGGDSSLPLVTVAVGSAIAVWAARERRSAIDARTAAEAERRQLRLLADAARITDGAADIDDALRRLVDLLVPDFARRRLGRPAADAAGALRRLAARVDGPDREELEAWLLARGVARRGSDLSPTTRALRGEGRQLAELDEPAARRDRADDDEDRRLHRALAAALDDGAAARAQRRAARRARRSGSGGRAGATVPTTLAFAELLVGRAGLALANAQLVGRLTAAQRRLDGILGALAEAVTVQTPERPDRVREPGGGDAARPARRARRAHRRARRARRRASRSTTPTGSPVAAGRAARLRA